MIDTDDLVQETVVSTLKHIDVFKYRVDSALQAYLRQAGMNRIRNEIRKAMRHPASTTLDGAAPDPGSSPLEELIGKQTVEAYDEAMTTLEPEEREAIIGRVELGLSYAELATRAHGTGDQRSLATARPDLPAAFIHIVETFLATDPVERYQTAGAAEAALRRWLEQSSAAERSLRHRLAITVGAIVLATALGGAAWLSGWHRSGADTPPRGVPLTLRAGDWIVVAEFDNQTGESVLDGTLRTAVQRELEYSDFVRVAQRDRLEDALKLLPRPLDTRLNRDLALELSRRDGGIGAVVSGAITKADAGYTLTFDVVDPASQTTVVRLSDHARGYADVLGVMRDQTLRFRQAVGEPAASIERSREALQGAALPSVKAMNLMGQAKTMMNLRDTSPVSEWMKIEKIAREIVQEDARFPAGHFMLAWAVTNQRREKEAVVHLERALDLTDSATPQERYLMVAGFHGHKARRHDGRIVDRQELEKAAAAWEALFALQPDHYALRGNLSNIYRLLGRERDRTWMHMRLADARPWSVNENVIVADQLLRQGNIEGARRYGARAESALSPGAAAARPDLAAAVRLYRAYIAWVQEDPAETVRTLDQVAGTAERLPDSERHALYLRLWPLYAAVGHLRKAEAMIEAARRADGNASANRVVVDMARASLFEDQGNSGGLREFAATQWREPLSSGARPLFSRRVPFLIEAVLLDDAERDLEWFKRRTAQTSEWAPRAPTRQFEPFYATNSALLELARGRLGEAVVLLRQLMPAIREGPPPLFTLGGSQGQYAAVKLAEALEATGRVPEAIATLEEAVSDRVAVTIANTPNRWLRTSAQLARLYRKNGQEEKARAVEAQLLKLLAAADADHPLVAELRRGR
jgi:tetratricopeptide (TPR) repeat protein